MDVQTIVNLALQQHRAGRPDAAVEMLRQAASQHPDSAEVFGAMGAILLQTNDAKAAVLALQKAVALRPDYAAAYSNLGNALCAVHAFDLAVQALNKAIALKSDFSGAHYNLGMAMENLGRFDLAAAAYEQALRLDPGYADAANNLANVLQSAGRLDEAIAAYRRAVEMRPQFAWAHWNLGLALLARGEYAEGWREFEWRLKVNEPGHPRPNFSQPRWDGGELCGRRILLWTEQGFGDMIQFARYIALVVARGGKPIIYCPNNLVRLFQRFGGVEVLERGQPLPAFDVECPLMSLPLVVGTTMQTIPDSVPYLSGEVEMWGSRLIADGRRRVGLAWSGRRLPDPRRTVPAEQLLPLAAARGVRWISLQRAEAETPHSLPPAELAMDDWTGELRDFADTAALVHHLDLVITIDTAVAHLAGAMGKPVWLMLPLVADWRWTPSGESTPWYRSMRLFRQERFGDWAAPIRRIVEQLTQ
ncbi:MAG TPA: tetratricopeptide repeat-containing glycosyltransferase family protein [Tepidisphaeraceae bacterium]|nr:tetratricopeptide repeat-containing glycosyltransferase family protein [Tepidisphaeraceae bacterium]